MASNPASLDQFLKEMRMGRSLPAGAPTPRTFALMESSEREKVFATIGLQNQPHKRRRLNQRLDRMQEVITKAEATEHVPTITRTATFPDLDAKQAILALSLDEELINKGIQPSGKLDLASIPAQIYSSAIKTNTVTPISRQVSLVESKTAAAPISRQTSEPESKTPAVLGTEPKLGDWVRVKKDVAEPRYGWGSASHECIGRVMGTSSDDDANLIVKWMYPEPLIKSWHAAPVDLEVCANPFETYDINQQTPLGNLAGRFNVKRASMVSMQTKEEKEDEMTMLMGTAALVGAMQWLGGSPSSLSDVYLSVTSTSEEKNVSPIRVAAHRAILSAWSEPFRKMFQSEQFRTIPFGGIVEIAGDPTVFRTFVRFMYQPVARLTQSNAFGLLKLASIWGVKELERQCVRYIKRMMTVANLVEVWGIAELIYCDELTNYCRDLAARDIRYTHALLSTNQLFYALQSDNLAVGKECEVFTIVAGRINKLQNETKDGKTKDGKAFTDCARSLMSTIRVANLPTGFIEDNLWRIPCLLDEKGKLMPDYMKVLIQEGIRPPRTGLRFSSFDEVKKGMLVRVVNGPELIELCAVKPPGAMEGPVNFVPPMAKLCGKILPAGEKKTAILSVKFHGYNVPYTCIERVSAREEEILEAERRETFSTLKLGDLFDVLDDDTWRPAFVKKIKDDSKTGMRELLMSYYGYAQKYDEFIKTTDPRLQVLHTHTKELRRVGFKGKANEISELEQEQAILVKEKGNAAMVKLEKSRQNSDKPCEWPPSDVDITALRNARSKVRWLMNREISLRRVAQLANVRVASRIEAPRFGGGEEYKAAETDAKRMAAERTEVSSDLLVPSEDQVDVHIMPKVRLLWNGERDETKLTLGLEESDACLVRVLLSVVLTHELQQAEIEARPGVRVLFPDDVKLEGEYTMTGAYKDGRPEYKNRHGTRLHYDIGWHLEGNDKKFGHKSAKGFTPPLGQWPSKAEETSPVMWVEIESEGNEKAAVERNKEEVAKGEEVLPDLESQLTRMYGEASFQGALKELCDIGFPKKEVVTAINMAGTDTDLMLKYFANIDDDDELDLGGLLTETFGEVGAEVPEPGFVELLDRHFSARLQ